MAPRKQKTTPVRNHRVDLPFEWVEAKLKEGMSASEMAKEKGCSVRTVTRAIRAYELEEYIAKTEVSKEQLLTLYVEQDMTESEVAEALGCSAPTIHRALVKHGIERRPRGPAGERSPNARVDEEMVRLILKSFFEENVTLQKLAEATGLTKQAVSHIVNRKTWKHVEYKMPDEEVGSG